MDKLIRRDAVPATLGYLNEAIFKRFTLKERGANKLPISSPIIDVPAYIALYHYYLPTFLHKSLHKQWTANILPNEDNPSLAKV